MRPPQISSPGRLAGAVVFVAVGALVVIVATPRSTTLQASRTVSRVALPTPYPQSSSECPQMSNPGGKLLWEPSPDAAPRTTDGRITIPKLGVEAPIVRVGINTAGQMMVPRNARDVAWLDQGSFPGPVRNAVLAGHIKWSGVPGSFNRIGDLASGDRFVVQFGERRLTYEVIWSCAFNRSTEFAEQIMGYTHEPSVTLITCGGEFDSAARTHTKRMVVRAELVQSV